MDELVRDGARQMLAAALQAEVAAYIEQFADVRDEDGHRLVVRNGYHEQREVATGAGAVTVTAPRVNDKRVDPETGERQRFSSKILPAWARKSPKVARGVAVAVPARDVVGGLRAGVGAVPRLGARAVRGDDDPVDDAVAGRGTAFGEPGPVEVDFVYLWVDGIHVNVRLEQEKLCLLVMIGVRADGRKELVALTDGYRESTESWADLLRDCQAPRDAGAGAGDGRRRVGVLGGVAGGVPRDPGAAVLVPQDRRMCLPRCRSRRTRGDQGDAGNLQRRGQRPRQGRGQGVQDRLRHEVPEGRREDHRRRRRVAEFYNYPAEHWVHLRTTNPIESTFATVRHRSKVTKGPGSRAAGLAMAFKLIEAAQARWRAVNAPHLVALVRAGATFHNGKLVERPETTAA